MLNCIDLQSFEFWIVLLLAKVTIILTATLFFYRIFHNKSAQLKHSLLATCLILLPIVVVLHFREPTLKIPIQLASKPIHSTILKDAKSSISIGRSSANTKGTLNEHSVDDTATTTKRNGQSASEFVDRVSVESESFDKQAEHSTDAPSQLTLRAPAVQKRKRAEQNNLAEWFRRLKWIDVLLFTWAIVAFFLMSLIGLAWATIVLLTKRSTNIQSHAVSACLSPSTQQLIKELNLKQIYVKVSPNAQQFPLGAGLFFRTCVEYRKSSAA